MHTYIPLFVSNIWGGLCSSTTGFGEATATEKNNVYWSHMHFKLLLMYRTVTFLPHRSNLTLFTWIAMTQWIL